MEKWFCRLKKIILKHDLFFKLFGMLFGCIIVPVAIACICFSLQTADLVRAQTERSNAAYLTMLSTQMEAAIDARKSQLTDYSLSEITTGSFRSSREQKEASVLLSSALATNQDLESIFVLDPDTNRVASNVGCFDAEIYFRKYCYFPDLSFEDLYGLLCNGRAFRLYVQNYTRFPRTDRARTSPSILLLYTFFARQPSNYTRVIGCVISPQLAEAFVDGSSISRQGEVCILDAEDNCFFSTSSNVVAELAARSDASSSEPIKLNGEAYVVQRLSAAYGLQYINAIPLSQYNAGMQSIRSFSLLLIAVLLALVILLSALFSSRLSQPILHLADSFSKEKLSEHGSPIENTAAYRSIYSNIDQIRASNERLSTLMQHGQKQLRSSMLLDLLRGKQQDPRFLSYQLTELHAQFTYDYYTVVLLSFDFFKRAYLDYTPVELAHIQDGICKLTLSWPYPFQSKIEVVECAPSTFAFLINTDTLQIEPLCHELEQILQLADIENEQLRLIFATTSFVNQLEELPDLFQAAQNALRYRVLNRQSQLIRSDRLPSAGHTSVLLTAENKTFITNYLTSGNCDAAKNYICALIERSADSGIPYEHLITAFSAILALIAQILADRSISFFSLFDTDPFIELNSLNSLDEICDFFRSVCTKVDAAMMSRQRQDNDILRRSLEYISQNYQNRISLDDVSAYAGYSPKYFSRYFKDQTGITFVNYLNRLRIQAAKELLADPNIVIKDVAAQVGFENINTFFRVFKQFEGVTPGQWRTALAANTGAAPQKDSNTDQ